MKKKNRLCYTASISNIATVVFDFGNVLTIWNPYNAVKDKYTSTEFDEFMNAVNWHDLIELWDGGATHAEIKAIISEIDYKKGTNYAEVYDYYVPRFTSSIEYHISGMHELVLDLQKLGIKTYGLTNWAAEDIDDAIATVPAISAMQGIVVSGVEKVKKPNPKIYQILFERYNVKPETAIFIDDKVDNTNAARALGMQVFHLEPPFETAGERFRAHLRELGISV